MPFRVAVVANCQARPLAALMTQLAPNVEVTGIGIVHLLRDEQQDEYRPMFESADVIVAQQVATNYPCHFVRTDALRERYGSKVLSIVNLYYAGYNPELVYVRGLRTPANGPLGEYHIAELLRGWAEGISIDETLERMTDVAWNDAIYADAPRRSLAELARRERSADVEITSYLTDHLAEQKLFHTMNHPSNRLLLEYAKRIVTKMGETESAPVTPPAAEMLGQFRLPLNPGARRWLSLQFEDETDYVGHAQVASEDGRLRFRGRGVYSARSLVETFYRAYDACGAELREHALRTLPGRP